MKTRFRFSGSLVALLGSLILSPLTARSDAGPNPADTTVFGIIDDEDPYHYQFHDLVLFAHTNYIHYTPIGPQQMFGIKLRMYLSNRISMDADVSLNGEMGQFGPGIIGIPVFYFWVNRIDRENREADDDEYDQVTEEDVYIFLVKAFLVALSAEHMTYHIPVSQTMRISPFISLYRHRVYPKGTYDTKDEVRPYFGLGTELNVQHNRFFITPYAEYNMDYARKHAGIHGGAAVGIMF